MQSSAQKNNFVILGAGISGLTAARALQEQGYESIVLEACPSAGGLTRSIKVGDFCFDYTGHFLHLARFSSPQDIPYAGLKNADWGVYERKSCCYIDGRLVPAPVQYHLRHLPSPTIPACVESYNARPPLPQKAEVSFRDYLLSGFGEYLSDLFLIPQNEKTLGISLDRISGKAVKRFFPPPDEALIRAGIERASNSSSEYNSTFWYPLRGGIGTVIDRLGNGLSNLQVLQEAVAVDVKQKIIRTQTGDSWQWNVLLSSIPLPDLCRKTNDPELATLANNLSHSATIVFNIGVRAHLPPGLEGIHWIYLPDRSLPFYRVGFYSNINQGMCAPRCYSLYVEVGVNGADLDTINVVEEIQPKVFNALSNLGWVQSKNIVCCVAHIIRCAYVHHTFERERVIERIFNRLESFNIYPIGRYGQWDYISMEDSIISAIETVKKLF